MCTQTKPFFQFQTKLILIEDRHEVYWGHVSMLEGDLKCLHKLLEIPDWKFFINQAGTAMPLMKIGQIEQKLKYFEMDSIQSEIVQPGYTHRFIYKHSLRYYYVCNISYM